MSKRKKEDLPQMFQGSWTLDYLFIEWKEKPLCLICGKNVSAAKLLMKGDITKPCTKQGVLDLMENRGKTW